MKLAAFISDKLSGFGIEVSEVELGVQIELQDVDSEADYSKDTDVIAKKVLVSFIPQLLLTKNVSEGGYSVSVNVDGIKAYYSMLCEELGLPDKVNQNLVRDRSNLW